VPNTLFHHVYNQQLGQVSITYSIRHIPKMLRTIAKYVCSDCKLVVTANLTTAPHSEIDQNGVVLLLEGEIGASFVRKNKTTNIKLFTNGAIQMTGCKSMEGAMEALTKIFTELKTVKATLDYKLNRGVERNFATNTEILGIDNIFDVKICMINSNFCIEFNIDRDKLFDLLIRDKIECSYDPIIHACVNIKYEHREKTISIFVFESGAVIITGARNCNQIVEAYNFINKYLLKNYNYINKNNILTNSTILEFLNSDLSPEDVRVTI